MTLQTDPSWLPSRHGALTASRFKDAIDFLKNGKESEARKKYRQELVAERIAGYAVERFVTPAMRRGLELEVDAKAAFEEHTGWILGPARLFEHPTIPHFMATPDGTYRSDTTVEFKVPQVHTYIGWYETGVIPPEHVPQLACQLIVTGRQKAVFCAYCPEMPEPHRLFIREYEPTAEVLADYEAQAVKFLDEVEAMFVLFSTTEAAA